MSEHDDFLAWVNTTLYDAERALHNGDPEPRRAIWSRNEPVSILGAWRNAIGPQQIDELFTYLGTAGPEHTSASVDGEPRTYTLRATQVYRREDGEWRVAHRHGDTVAE